MAAATQIVRTSFAKAPLSKSTQKELDAKLQDVKYVPSVDDFKEYLHLQFDSIPKEKLSLWMAMNVIHGWDQTPVTYAADIVHAMLLFEEKKVQEFVSTAFECAMNEGLLCRYPEVDDDERETGRMVTVTGDTLTWADVMEGVASHFAEGDRGDPILIQMKLV